MIMVLMMTLLVDPVVTRRTGGASSHDMHSALCPTTCQDGDDGVDDGDDDDECSDNDDGERQLYIIQTVESDLIGSVLIALKSSLLSFFWRKN